VGRCSLCVLVLEVVLVILLISGASLIFSPSFPHKISNNVNNNWRDHAFISARSWLKNVNWPSMPWVNEPAPKKTTMLIANDKSQFSSIKLRPSTVLAKMFFNYFKLVFSLLVERRGLYSRPGTRTLTLRHPPVQMGK